MLDNHASHSHRQVRELVDGRLTLAFQPSYSSQFNPIESVWGLAKQAFTKLLALRRDALTKDAFDELVLEALGTTDRHVQAILRVNRAYIRQHLAPVE